MKRIGRRKGRVGAYFSVNCTPLGQWTLGVSSIRGLSIFFGGLSRGSEKYGGFKFMTFLVFPKTWYFQLSFFGKTLSVESKLEGAETR